MFTPSTLEKYIALNHDIFIEKNAGIKSGFSDNDYVNAELSSRNNIYNKCDIIVSVNSSSILSFSELKNKSIISNFSMNPDKQNLSKDSVAK